MNCETDNAASLGAGHESGMSHRPFLVRALWIVCGATLLIFLLFFSLGFIKLSETGRRMLAIFLYSACIGLLSMVLVPYISVRYTHKLPRLIALLQAFCLIFTATAGSLAADLVLQIIGIIPRGDFWSEYRGSLPFSIVITLAIGMSVSTYETLRYKLQAATWKPAPARWSRSAPTSSSPKRGSRRSNRASIPTFSSTPSIPLPR